MKNTSFFQILKIKDFLKIWGSQVLSQLTLNLVNFVIILRIFEATHSTVAISLVWIFYAIPALLVGPFSGTVVDLLPKRRILMGTTFFEALAVFCYLFVKQRIWPIYPVIFLYSLVNQFYVPAEASTLPWVVSKKLFPIANYFFLFTMYGTFLLGAGLAGPLVRLVGYEAPFLIGFFSLLVACCLVSRLPEGTRKKVGGFGEFWQQAKDGYIFIKGHPLVLYPLLLFVLTQIVVSVVTILAPSFTVEVLGVDLRDAGPLLILPAGLGAILGAQLVVSLLHSGMRKKKIITAGLFTGGVLFLSFALFVPLFGQIRSYIASVVALFLGGSLVSLIIPVQTLIQEGTPEDFRGRVFGVLSFGVTLASVLPVLLIATFADVLGVRWVMVLISVFILIVAFYSLKERNGLIHTNNRS